MIRHIDAAAILMMGALGAVTPAVVGAAEAPLAEHHFSVTRAADVTATITASCQQCDWSARGREGVALAVQVGIVVAAGIEFFRRRRR